MGKLIPPRHWWPPKKKHGAKMGKAPFSHGIENCHTIFLGKI